MLFIIVIIIRHYLIVFQKTFFVTFNLLLIFFYSYKKININIFCEKACFFLVVYYIMILNYQINVVVAKGLKNKTALQTVLIRV